MPKGCINPDCSVFHSLERCLFQIDPCEVVKPLLGEFLELDVYSNNALLQYSSNIIA